MSRWSIYFKSLHITAHYNDKRNDVSIWQSRRRYIIAAANNKDIIVLSVGISSNIISNKHIKAILLGQDGSVFKGITFNAVGGPIESILNKKNRKKINVAGKMKLNEWRGEKKVEFIIEDISV